MRKNIDELYRLRGEDATSIQRTPNADNPNGSSCNKASTSTAEGLTYKTGEPPPLKADLVSSSAMLQGSFTIIPAQALPEAILSK